MARSPRIFAGQRLRELRRRCRLNQRDMAALLGISVSYLSQVESDDRPITTTVLKALATHFPDQWISVDEGGDAALAVRALHAASDPSVPAAIGSDTSVRRTLSRQPAIAHRLIALHDAVLHGEDRLRALDDRVETNTSEHGPLPYEEVRDWFHDQRNYLDTIDRAAEDIAAGLIDPTPYTAIAERLRGKFGIAIVTNNATDPLLRNFDAAERTLHLGHALPFETQTFSLAYQLVRLELPDVIQSVQDASALSPAAKALLLAGLTNYAAGALLMPYARFSAAAVEVRHDIDQLRQRFGTSFEQTCHRLSTLQRPGAGGLPFFFCRIDMAGNITKRHSATRLQFARFGGGCPLWIVHEAVAIPDRILVQFAETPDGTRYVSMAKGLVKPSGSYARPSRRYAVALGCEIDHAADFVYADSIRTSGNATPIGTSCRICPRMDCEQRAFPPSAGALQIDPDRRGTVPYTFG